jgi:hypothetical protein
MVVSDSSATVRYTFQLTTEAPGASAPPLSAPPPLPALPPLCKSSPSCSSSAAGAPPLLLLLLATKLVERRATPADNTPSASLGELPVASMLRRRATACTQLRVAAHASCRHHTPPAAWLRRSWRMQQRHAPERR